MTIFYDENRQIAEAVEVPCACGCGQMVKTVFTNGKPVLYRNGHIHVKGGQVARGTKKVCPQCNVEFTITKNPKAIYCSRACYWKARGVPWSPTYLGRWIGDKKESLDWPICRSASLQRKHLLKRRQSCDKCGWNAYPNLLELHHVDEDRTNGRFGNLQLLCPNCHEIHHYLKGTGRFDKDRYSRTKEIREKMGLTRTPRLGTYARLAAEEDTLSN